MIDLTTIIEALLGLLAAIITMYVIPWLKSKTTNEQQAKIEAALRVAVCAAEQLYGAGHGKEKLEYAAEHLRSRGYEVDEDAIEAAVYNYINTFKNLKISGEAESSEEA
jgi:hypothetical protein